MARTINFVGERRTKLTEAQKNDRKLLKISLFVLMGVFAIFLIVIGIRFYFVFAVKSVTDEQKDIRGVILSHESVEKEYIIFAQKLKQLSVFFGRREDKQEALVFFSNIFGEDVIVSGIDYSSADEDVVSFTIKTPNVFVMQRVFEILEKPEVITAYPRITKSNMRRSATGNYTIDLAIVLNEKAPAVVAPTSKAVTPEIEE